MSTEDKFIDAGQIAVEMQMPYTREVERPFYAWYIDCLQKSLCFSGRARPKEYWMYQLVGGIVAIGVSILLFFIMYLLGSAVLGAGGEAAGAGIAMAMLMLITGFWVVSLLPGLAACVRRTHDINVSGWVMLLAFVPGGNIALFVMMCLEGTAGENRYGKNPIQNPPARGTEFLSTVSSSYIQGLSAFSFFCPVCGLFLWATTKKSLPLISKKLLLWSAVGTIVTLAICILLSVGMSGNGYY